MLPSSRQLMLQTPWLCASSPSTFKSMTYFLCLLPVRSTSFACQSTCSVIFLDPRKISISRTVNTKAFGLCNMHCFRVWVSDRILFRGGQDSTATISMDRPCSQWREPNIWVWPSHQILPVTSVSASPAKPTHLDPNTEKICCVFGLFWLLLPWAMMTVEPSWRLIHRVLSASN